MRILDLPLDVWITIASLLSVEDILALQNTCKLLRGLMAERSIWHSVITDIASIIHLPGLLDQLPCMLTEDIRAKAVRTWGIHQELHSNPLKPRSVQKRTCDVNVMNIHFVPGGEWIVLAFFDGGLDICATRNIPQPAYSFPSEPERPGVNFKTGMSSSCRFGTLIHRTERRWSQRSTIITIFCIDCLAPNITPVKEIVFNEGIIYHISLEFDLLAITWSVESTGRTFTRIVSVIKEHNKGIVMELGLDDVDPNLHIVQILSPGLLLVTCDGQYHLYEIPMLAAIGAQDQPGVNQAQLIWSSKRLGEPLLGGHFVRRLPNTNSCINVVDLCGPSVNVLALSKQPKFCQILQETTSHNNDGPYLPIAMASTHAFWVPLRATPNLISLRARSYPTPLARRTSLRGFYNNTDLSTRSLEMTVESAYEVRDLIWDESGRLCILASALRPEDPLIVLLLEFA